MNKESSSKPKEFWVTEELNMANIWCASRVFNSEESAKIYGHERLVKVVETSALTTLQARVAELEAALLIAKDALERADNDTYEAWGSKDYITNALQTLEVLNGK